MLLMIILIIVLAPLNGFKTVRKIRSYLYRTVCYNMVIRFIIEGYYEFAISVFLNIQVLRYNMLGDSLNAFFTIGFIFIVSVFPGFAVIFLLANKRNLHKEAFEFKFGSFYESLKTKENWSLMFIPLFLFRRLILAIVLVFCAEFPFLQI